MQGSRLFDVSGVGRVEVAGDGEGVVSHAGALLPRQVADRIGLTEALGVRPRSQRRRVSAHDPGVVLRDLIVSLVDGGGQLSDLATLREQPEVFGRVASHPTVWRTLNRIADDEAGGADGIAAARDTARARVWERTGAPLVDGMVVVDLDATIVTCESDKVDAKGTFKRTFGFHPLLAYLDHGDGTGDPLAGVLRAGNAGSNTAADHIDVLEQALAALPASPEGTPLPLLVRTDGAGFSHAFVDELRARRIRFCVGYQVGGAVRDTLAVLPETAWTTVPDPADEPANRTERRRRRRKRWRPPTPGKPRPQVAELDFDPAAQGWPEGTRLVVRRERRSPGEQAQLGDVNGYRVTTFLTDQPDDLLALDRRHRHHAHVEQRIRDLKDLGLGNFPHYDFRLNQVWLQAVLCAQALTVWTQKLTLTGKLAAASPKTLRQRLWHTAARVVRHARRIIVRYQQRWRWTPHLIAAFDRLAALPPPRPG